MSEPAEVLVERSYSSPLGRLRLIACEDALVGLYFPDHQPIPAVSPAQTVAALEHPVLERAAAQLDAYFAGSLQRFTLPLAPRGTAFQREVWAMLRELPHGRTCSYATLARMLGRPRAVRAVGSANARNPLSIIVPCHRVLGSKGDLSGYAGGLARKRWLLEHEGLELATPGPRPQLELWAGMVS